MQVTDNKKRKIFKNYLKKIVKSPSFSMVLLKIIECSNYFRLIDLSVSGILRLQSP